MNNYYSKFIILVVACILIFFYSNSPQKLSVFSAEAKNTDNNVNLQPPASSFRGPNYAPFFKVNKTIEQTACADEFKVLWGNKHHGGWYVCNVFQQKHPKDCIVYSYGLGADWSFDIAASSAPYNCQVHGFDPSGLLWRQGMHGEAYSGIDYAKQYPGQNRHFHNWGIGAAAKVLFPPNTVPQEWPGLGDPQLSKSNSEPWELRSIEQAIEDLGHLDKVITVLKIDVEGAEWDALAAFLGSERMKAFLSQGRVQQLLLEFHWDPDSRARNSRHEQIMNSILAEHFVPWNIERHEGSDCCLDVSYIWRK